MTVDGTKQVVFDLSAGSFKSEAANDGDASGDANEGGRAALGSEPEPPSIDPETEAVLGELADLDVNGTAPVEILARVQRWQERLNGSNNET